MTADGAELAVAYDGEPFGVATVEFDVPASEFSLPFDHPIAVVERDRRVLYPVVTRSDRQDADVVRLRARFLFRGREPLHIGLVGGESHRVSLDVAVDPAKRAVELQAWWSDYSTQFRDEFSNEPTATETYLVGMLGRRLGLRAPRSHSRWRSTADMVGGPAEWTDLFALLTGTASVRTAMQRRTLLDVHGREAEVDGVPLPDAVVPPPIDLPEFEQPEIEAIARHVPEECFYVRYARPSNIAWLAEAADNFTTLLGGLVSPVTFDDGHRERLARQLALPDSTVSRLFAEDVVEDVAMIGTDLLVEDGAAIGFVFEVGVEPTFDRWVRRDRDRTLATTPRANRRTVELSGEGFDEVVVELLSTPDNRVRSFLVRDGRFRLVTNSRFVARRFLEAGRGHGSLGGLREFGYARSKIGVERRDPIFAYLSDPFFRSILGPHYRVEMTRRVRARGEIELVEFARLAHLAEGHEGRPTIERLIETNLLPPTFGQWFDGSRVSNSPTGLVDSLRGAPGTFLPVRDVTIETVTPEERSAYQAFGRAYARVWQGQRLDPVVVAVHPTGDEEDPRVAVDVLVTPFARAHYPDPTWFAAPEYVGIDRITDELATVDVVLPRQLGTYFGKSDRTRPLHVIGGVLDLNFPIDVEDGLPVEPKEFEQPPAFLGVSRQLEDGMIPGAARGDRWTVTTDLVRSRETPVWAGEVADELRFAPTERAAQLRARLGDLGRSKLRPAIEAVLFCLARQSSARNVRELDRFAQQFRLDPSTARHEFERVHCGRIVCPLGGDYVLADDGRLDRRWRGTFWPHESLEDEDEVPGSFRVPALDWFRGVELEFSLVGDTLVSHVEVSVPAAFLPEDGEGITQEVERRRVDSRIVTGVPSEESVDVKRIRELGGIVHYVSSAAAFGENDRGTAFPLVVTLGPHWKGRADDWNSVAKAPGLGHLTIEKLRITKEDLERFGRAETLRGLTVRDIRLGPDVLAGLAAIPNLEMLTFTEGEFTAAHARALLKCAGLERLDLGRLAVDRDVVEVLPTLPALRSVTWKGQTYAAPGFGTLLEELPRVGPGQRLSWAPDGRRFVFSRLPSGSGVNLTLDVDSDDTRQLISPGNDPAWRPKHEQIAYVRKERNREHVWLYDLESRQHRRLTEGGFPGWSADGETLFLHSRVRKAVVSIDPDDTEAKPVEIAEATKWYPAVSPDGHRVAMQIDGRHFAIRDLRTGTVRKYEFETTENWRGFFPGWSPDGRFLAYGSYGFGDDLGLWVLDTRTGMQRRLVPGDATMPAWSPDGSRLAYYLRTRARQGLAILPTASLQLPRSRETSGR